MLEEGRMIALTIDPEFQVLIPPLTDEERVQMETPSSCLCNFIERRGVPFQVY
jgi:hypothetical protein